MKLDERSEGPIAPSTAPKEHKMRSPTGRLAKRSDSEKAFNLTWHGPKHLKSIFTIIQELGDEKHMVFGEFLHFYLMVAEISKNKRISGVKSIAPLVDRWRRASGKPEANMPYFLWAFMNPDRQPILKKKIIRDVLKVCNDNKNKGRKNLLDSLEEIVRNSERDFVDTQKSKLYFDIFKQ